MNEIEENSLEWAKQFKQKLRWDIGEIVYLRSDLKKKCPMTISKILTLDPDEDYVCTWSTSQKDIISEVFRDKVLCQ